LQNLHEVTLLSFGLVEIGDTNSGIRLTGIFEGLIATAIWSFLIFITALSYRWTASGLKRRWASFVSAIRPGFLHPNRKARIRMEEYDGFERLTSDLHLKINWALGVILTQMAFYFSAIYFSIGNYPAPSLSGLTAFSGILLLMVAATMIDKLNRPEKYINAVRQTLLRLYETGELSPQVIDEIKKRFPDLLVDRGSSGESSEALDAQAAPARPVDTTSTSA
jgi:hypothetical protein